MAIRKITPEERKNLKLKGGRTSDVRLEILTLEPGETLQIDYADYPYKHGPRFIIYRLHYQTDRRFKWRRLRDKSGFIVDRIS